MAAAIEETDAIDEVEGIPEIDSSIEIDYSRDGMFKARQQVIYAPTEDAFDAAWSRLRKDFGKHQMRILKYITGVYIILAWS
ncbi:hypothetical protein E4U40_006577 [Claviceps sp. LM458 group G5]|nr:hypothetical protein E4U40_006577 [Claviceps sp. LM458 group G5]